MKEELISLLDNAYAPYSGFKVASIVVMSDGNTFNGVNVENASYGATICAERSAITSAISNGYKKDDIESIHIISSSNKTTFPCLICRQVMVELFNPNTKIYLYSNDDIKTYTIEELTPHSFSKDDLL